MTKDELIQKLKEKYKDELEFEDQDILILLDKMNMYQDLEEMQNNSFLLEDQEMLKILALKQDVQIFYESPDWKQRIMSLQDPMFTKAISYLPERMIDTFSNEMEVQERILNLSFEMITTLFQENTKLAEKMIQIPRIYEKIIHNENSFFSSQIISIQNIQILENLLDKKDFQNRLSNLPEIEWNHIFKNGLPEFLRKISNYEKYMSTFATYQIDTLIPFISKIYDKEQQRIITAKEIEDQIKGLSTNQIYDFIAALGEYTLVNWINKNEDQIKNASHDNITQIVSATKSKAAQQRLLEIDTVYHDLIDPDSTLLLILLNNIPGSDTEKKLIQDPLLLDSIQMSSLEKLERFINALSKESQLVLYQNKSFIEKLTEEQINILAINVEQPCRQAILQSSISLTQNTYLNLLYKEKDWEKIETFISKLYQDEQNLKKVNLLIYPEITSTLTKEQKQKSLKYADMKFLSEALEKNSDPDVVNEIINRIITIPAFAATFRHWSILLSKAKKEDQEYLLYHINNYDQILSLYLKNKNSILEQKLIYLFTNTDTQEISELINFHFPQLYQSFDDDTRLQILPKLPLKGLARLNSELKNKRIYDSTCDLKTEIPEILIPDFIQWYQTAKDDKIKGLLLSFSTLNQLIEILKLEPENEQLIDHILKQVSNKEQNTELLKSESIYILLKTINLTKKEQLINQIPFSIWAQTLSHAKDTSLFPYFIQKWQVHPHSLNGQEIDNMIRLYQKLNTQEQKQLVTCAKDEHLCTLMKYLKKPILKQEWLQRKESNPNLLKQYSYNEMNQMALNLTKEEQQHWKNDLLDQVKEKTSSELTLLNHLLENKSIGEIVVLVNALNNTLEKSKTKKEQLKMVEALLIHNPHLLKTINFSILEERFGIRDISIIDKLSRDSRLQEQIIAIWDSTPQAKMIIQRSLEELTTEKNMKLGLRKLSLIIDSLQKEYYSKIWKEAKISLQDYPKIKQFLINNHAIFQIGHETEKIIPNNITDILEYQNRLDTRCDNIVNFSTNLNELQNAYFLKCCGLTKDEIEYIMISYSDDLPSFDPQESATKFLIEMANVLALQNVDQLKEKYSQIDRVYSIEEILQYEYQWKLHYGKKLVESLRPSNQPKPIGEVIYQGKKIPVFDALDYDYLLLHSLNAYGNIELLNNNYYDAWNLSSKTNNKICCYLGSPGMQATPPINGVVVGFDHLEAQAISLMAPYDLSTDESQWTNSIFQPRFMEPENLVNYMRKNYSEIVINRKRQTGINNQPNYILIYSDMDPKQKSKSYKAAVEMNVPIRYYDREKAARMQANSITEKIQEIKETHNLSLLEEILVQYENNHLGIEQNNSINWNDYFTVNEIQELFIDEVKNIKTMYEQQKIDQKSFQDYLFEIAKIVKKEQQKYKDETFHFYFGRDLDIDADEIYYYIKFIADNEKAFTTSKISAIIKMILSKSKEPSTYVKYKYIYELDSNLKWLNMRGLYGQETNTFHGLDHIERTTLFAHIMADQEGLSNYEKRLLIEATLEHDCGRDDDGSNTYHGASGAQKVIECQSEENDSDKRIKAALIEYHAFKDSDKTLNKICDKYGLDEIEKSYVIKLYPYLKDADALDRTRFPKASLDYLNLNMLRTSIAQELIPLAETIQQFYSKEKELSKSTSAYRK